MKTKDDLAQLGFSVAGKWQLDQKLKSGVRAALKSFQKERVIYAFVVDNVCKYVGICDDPSTTLVDRIGRYQAMVGAGTNERVCGLIQKVLSAGGTVEIMALKPEASLEFAGLNVDLVKGLENPLIQWADAEWNIKGKSLPSGIRYVSVSSLKPRSE